MKELAVKIAVWTKLRQNEYFKRSKALLYYDINHIEKVVNENLFAKGVRFSVRIKRINEIRGGRIK